MKILNKSNKVLSKNNESKIKLYKSKKINELRNKEITIKGTNRE